MYFFLDVDVDVVWRREYFGCFRFFIDGDVVIFGGGSDKSYWNCFVVYIICGIYEVIYVVCCFYVYWWIWGDDE